MDYEAVLIYTLFIGLKSSVHTGNGSCVLFLTVYKSTAYLQNLSVKSNGLIDFLSSHFAGMVQGLNVYSILRRDMLVLTAGAVDQVTDRLRRPIKR